MKTANTYLDIDPWCLRETGFHPERSRVSESLFSLANEYTGIRGSFDEGYSGDRLVGSYVNGLFETRKTRDADGYRGVSNRVCYMTNSVDWTTLRLFVGSEDLDLARSRYRDFLRVLDFRTGLLTRSFIWTLDQGGELECLFERLLSMDHPQKVYQAVSFRSLRGSMELGIRFALDFSPVHELYDINNWKCGEVSASSGSASILGISLGSTRRLQAKMTLHGESAEDFEGSNMEKGVALEGQIALPEGSWRRLVREVTLVHENGLEPLRGPVDMDFDTALKGNRNYWSGVWERSDIGIDGDPVNQQGIRFCIFQMEQTYRGAIPGTNIGAKGLSGEAYNGNAFWDTEAYCLPYYLLSNPQAARNLLEYRHRTLPQALERAKALDCRGACYPVATLDGTESCTLWQHASLQFQPSTAVAYGFWHLRQITGDSAFFRKPGLGIMVRICRFLVSRAAWSPRKKAWGFYGVMGPDEFQMMVNHNAYTNVMGQWTLRTTADALDEYAVEDPRGFEELCLTLNLEPSERDFFREVAEGMHIPRENGSSIIEQHEGYFDLPHVDVNGIPAEEFPLYHSWSYDRIYRNDMIKQPDVLMLMFLLNQSFTKEEKEANYAFYEPRCIHESSLSPSVHSILATELGRHREALDFFAFATRIDLDDYNRNTREGLHVTAIAGAWMNIVYGFGGFRSDGDLPVLNPVLPESWDAYRFQILYRGTRIRVDVSADRTSIRAVDGEAAIFLIAGEERRVDRDGVEMETRRAR